MAKQGIMRYRARVKSARSEREEEFLSRPGEVVGALMALTAGEEVTELRMERLGPEPEAPTGDEPAVFIAHLCTAGVVQANRDDYEWGLDTEAVPQYTAVYETFGPGMMEELRGFMEEELCRELGEYPELTVNWLDTGWKKGEGSVSHYRTVLAFSSPSDEARENPDGQITVHRVPTRVPEAKL